MIQLNLFGPEPDTPPCQNRSRTSRAAANALGERAESHFVRYLSWLRERGEYGATDDEAQSALSMAGSTQRPRRVKAVELGLVRDSGRERKTRAGRSAVVWVAVTDKREGA